ncbi:HAD-IA family hydrolase [Streptomyces hoynatensis]|uniref:HAD family hydrolase n=1 Tax=Streptomyces hoynatensis TaxID=1141874 RepID=A0A3A9Z3W4_9ACTN|nr:HAD-IA family hydrolase [Streptomyces hoynatensis]RKN43122.1 HAD family hydrolase [Streptomyces hoynatensis]
MTPRGAAGAFRGLVLDFGGVLAVGVAESTRAWCLREGLPPGAWGRTLEEHPEGVALYRDLERGLISQREWNLATAALLGVAPDNLMGRAWAEVRPAPAMIAVARAARAAGYAVAMLSNSFGLDPYDPYRRLGVWNLFDTAVLSERAGLAKPDPAIYRLLLDRLGLPGSACVFVDDQARNLPAAEALGLTTILAADPDLAAAEVAGLLGLTPPPARPRGAARAGRGRGRGSAREATGPYETAADGS